MTDPRAIIVAGGLAAGKTTLARGIAAIADAQVVSFGAYVRSEARARGLGTDRTSLQRLGAQLTTDPAAFVSKFLDWAAFPAEVPVRVIEGLRHVAVAVELRRQITDAEVTIVYLDVSQTLRRERYIRRGGGSEEFDNFERDPLEAGHGQVRRVADSIVDGAASPDEILAAVTAVVPGLARHPAR